ncbi:MAG: PD40 domain-containing protein, partial [Chloroflexota bacterium]
FSIFLIMLGLATAAQKPIKVDASGELFHKDQQGATFAVTKRISINSQGQGGNDESYSPAISGDGRYIGFYSKAANLVDGDSNNKVDAFVYDQETEEVTRISVNSDGTQGNDDSGRSKHERLSLSSDGTIIAFSSYATNLVTGDDNLVMDVFVHDLQSRQTDLVSISSDGTQGNSVALNPSISANGQFIAFQSPASNLVVDDANNFADIFVHDRNTGITELVSVASDGTQANNYSTYPSISADGRYVAFTSQANNLVPGDTNSAADVFVHDRQMAITKRISVASDGTEGDYSSELASISGDGRLIVFSSLASNLVIEDPEGARDVFIHDQSTGLTDILSLTWDGNLGNGDSTVPVISSDGKYVAFYSTSDGLIQDDLNSTGDIFLYDLQTKQTQRVSISSDGAEGNGESFTPSISQEGRFIAFSSEATNLVCGDVFHIRDNFVHDRFAESKPACRISTFLPYISRNFCGVLYQDDFSNPESGWPQGQDVDSGYQYIQGEYNITVKNANWSAAASPGFQAEDYVVSVDVRNAGNVYGTYGIVFGLAENWSRLYTFEIDPEGYFGIWRFNDSEGWNLLYVDSSPYINIAEGINHLKVKRDGAIIEVHANGRLLTTITDGSFLGLSSSGLIATTYDQENLNVFYDNFTVSSATCGGAPQLMRSTDMHPQTLSQATDKKLE